MKCVGTDADPFSPFSINILDRTSRGLLSSGAEDKAICQDKRTYNGSYLCLSGQKIVAMERFLQNKIFFNKTVYIEGDTFGKPQ
jgi:hypothetical protein